MALWLHSRHGLVAMQPRHIQGLLGLLLVVMLLVCLNAMWDVAASRLLLTEQMNHVRPPMLCMLCMLCRLLQPPLPGAVVLGVDPAFRTGCKLAVCDTTGAAAARCAGRDGHLGKGRKVCSRSRWEPSCRALHAPATVLGQRYTPLGYTWLGFDASACHALPAACSQCVSVWPQEKVEPPEPFLPCSPSIVPLCLYCKIIHP